MRFKTEDMDRMRSVMKARGETGETEKPYVPQTKSEIEEIFIRTWLMRQDWTSKEEGLLELLNVVERELSTVRGRK